MRPVRTIKASSVYVDSLNTYFYASAADEEGGVEWTHPWAVTTPIVSGQTDGDFIQGRMFNAKTVIMRKTS